MAAPERPDKTQTSDQTPVVRPDAGDESPFDVPAFEEVEKGLKPSEVPSRRRAACAVLRTRSSFAS